MGATILGTCDDVTTCDCCGKQNLKLTVALCFDGDDRTVYYGTTCAAKATARPAVDIRRDARAADQEREARARAEEKARRDAELKMEAAELNLLVPQFAGNLSKQIEVIGGYQKARVIIGERLAARGEHANVPGGYRKAVAAGADRDEFVTAGKPGMLGLYAITTRLIGRDESSEGSLWADSEEALRAKFSHATSLEVVAVERLRWRDIDAWVAK